MEYWEPHSARGIVPAKLNDTRFAGVQESLDEGPYSHLLNPSPLPLELTGDAGSRCRGEAPYSCLNVARMASVAEKRRYSYEEPLLVRRPRGKIQTVVGPRISACINLPFAIDKVLGFWKRGRS
jgi:hypothetical protein